MISKQQMYLYVEARKKMNHVFMRKEGSVVVVDYKCLVEQAYLEHVRFLNDLKKRVVMS